MLKLWIVLALASAGAPAATELVILSTGTPRAESKEKPKTQPRRIQGGWQLSAFTVLPYKLS
jgi:hypothetical protein